MMSRARNYGKENKRTQGVCASLFAVSLLFSGPQAFAFADEKPVVEQKEEKKSGEAQHSGEAIVLDGLKFLPLARKKQKKPAAFLPLPRASAGVGDPGLSLRFQGQKVGDNFFYLKDKSDGSVIPKLDANPYPFVVNDTLDAQTFADLPVGQSVIGYNTSRLGVILSPKDKENPYGTGLELALQSSMYLTVNHENLGVSEAFVDREYAIGLSMGYYGFNVDASILEQDNSVNPELKGYGVGLSYSTKRLWTRLGYKDLNAQPFSYTVASLSGRFMAAEMNSLELQAAYSLTNSLKVMGGVKYSIHGDPLYGTTVYRDNTQSVYLGTRWSF